MILQDLKTDFYSRIRGERLLILVNYDIDAICACKILQALLSSDGMIYSVVPVDLKVDLLNEFRENYTDERYVVFLNCGGTVDLLEYLTPTDSVQFFVIDSHRPLDEANIFSTSQVQVFATSEDIEKIPAYADIYRDDDDEEEEEDSPDEDSEEAIEQRIEKRQERRNWEKRRYDILVDYHCESYYGASCASNMFDLAWKLSKDNFDLLWYGIVGVSEQLLMNKIDGNRYLKECGELQNHISRLTHRGDGAPEDRGVSVNITFEQQLKLAMYRQWTLEDSLMHSVATATKLRLWTFDGVKRLHEMLAEIGIPLVQCRQKFSAMQTEFRQDLQKSLAELGPRYGLQSIEQASFVLHSGYQGQLGAMDAVHGLVGLLIADKGKADRFLDALEALSRSRRPRLEIGVVSCQQLLQMNFRTAQNALDGRLIRNSGTFVYLVLQEAGPTLFHPYGLVLLAQFVQQAYVVLRKSRGSLPLLLSAPCNSSEADEDLCHVVSLPPASSPEPSTFFGQAFIRASEMSQTEILSNYFDSSVIIIRRKDRSKFFDSLTTLLE